MAKDHGPSIKDDKQYEGLRKKGMSKQRAAAIANDPDSSEKGGKASGSGKRRDTKSQGGPGAACSLRAALSAELRLGRGGFRPAWRPLS